MGLIILLGRHCSIHAHTTQHVDACVYGSLLARALPAGRTLKRPQPPQKVGSHFYINLRRTEGPKEGGRRQESLR
jgi:hypothetical protein